jgi:hypothetical protein
LYTSGIITLPELFYLNKGAEPLDLVEAYLIRAMMCTAADFSYANSLAIPHEFEYGTRFVWKKLMAVLCAMR